MNRHLVAIKVSVEAFADQRMQMDRVTFDKSRFKRLNTHPVQRRSTIQKNRVVLDHELEDIPNFFILPLEHFLGALDGVGVSEFLELADNERLEQFQSDFFGKAALVQFQFRSNNDHTTS